MPVSEQRRHLSGVVEAKTSAKAVVDDEGEVENDFLQLRFSALFHQQCSGAWPDAGSLRLQGRSNATKPGQASISIPAASARGPWMQASNVLSSPKSHLLKATPSLKSFAQRHASAGSESIIALIKTSILLDVSRVRSL